MALLKKKTRKQIRKIVQKAVNKHGPLVAEHLATAVVAALATYIGAEGNEALKKLKKAVKDLGKKSKIANAVVSSIPALSDYAHHKKGRNGDAHDDDEDREKKSKAA
jgi:ABC-type transporter Mla subunit MlaD